MIKKMTKYESWSRELKFTATNLYRMGIPAKIISDELGGGQVRAEKMVTAIPNWDYQRSLAEKEGTTDSLWKGRHFSNLTKAQRKALEEARRELLRRD